MTRPNPDATLGDYQVHLFLVRLWRERLGEGQYEWRGELKNTQDGAVRYFRSAASLHAGLLAMLEVAGGTEPNPESPDQAF